MSYPEAGRVETLGELEAFLDRVGGFHDGVLKEIHWVNLDFVRSDLSMLPSQGANLRMLVQRQWADPSAVEMTLFDVRRLRVDMFGDWIFWVAGFEEGEHLGMEFVKGSDVVFRTMEYRFVSDWMGPEMRLGLRPI